MTDSALIIFLRKPELGRVKTRLAKGIGDEKALLAYNLLSKKTFDITKNLKADIFPFFKPEKPENTFWNKDFAQIQEGNDLGECMKNAFQLVFERNYKKVIIIGSDCYSLSSETLEKAFYSLQNHDFTIGPSEDGGYYLLGMKKLAPELFSDIEWSNEAVFQKTLDKIGDRSVHILETLNDIDTLEDLKKEPELYNQVI